MLWLIIFGAAFLTFGVLTYLGLLPWADAGANLWGLWLVISILAGITTGIMGATAIGTKYETRAFVVEYNSHVAYLQSIQTKRISDKERNDEINTINAINQSIANAALNKGDLWVGPWVKDIGELKPLSFTSVPQAVDIKDVTLTQNK